MTLSSWPDQGHVTLSWEETYISANWIKKKMLASISAWHQTHLALSSAEKPVFISHVSLSCIQPNTVLYHESWMVFIVSSIYFIELFLFNLYLFFFILFSDLWGAVTKFPWCNNLALTSKNRRRQSYTCFWTICVHVTLLFTPQLSLVYLNSTSVVLSSFSVGFP